MSKPQRATRASERARFNRFLTRSLQGLTDAELDAVEVNLLSAYLSDRVVPTGKRGRPVSADEIVQRITSAAEYICCEDARAIELMATHGERGIGAALRVSGPDDTDEPEDPDIHPDNDPEPDEEVERVEGSTDALDHAESIDDLDSENVDFHVS